MRKEILYVERLRTRQSKSKQVVHVRELVGWVRNVVLMNVYLDLENPGGSGFRVRGHMG